ncbi:MAG: hypothetical protein ACOYO0_09310, partial [Sandarakinorhabdus sp.]
SSIDDFTSLMRSMDTRLGILDRKLSLSPPLNNPLNAHPPKQFETEPKRHKDGPQSAENGGILEVLANPQFWLTLIMIVVIGVGSILFMTGRLKFIGLS